MRTARALILLVVGIVGLGAFAAPASADRSHRHHRPHGGVVVRPSVSLSWGPAWGYWSPWWYAAPAWGGYPVVYPNNNYGAYGALDTDVSPERADSLILSGRPLRYVTVVLRESETVTRAPFAPAFVACSSAATAVCFSAFSFLMRSLPR